MRDRRRIVRSAGVPERRARRKPRAGRRPRRWDRIAAIWILAHGAWALPAEEDAMQRGALALEARDFAGALALFDEAARDPANPEAHFFAGAALNRLGRHGEALERLADAEERDVRHRDMAFESGWALLGLGRWAEAIEQLEWYERHHPGRAQAAEFLGRAYYHAGDVDRARPLLEEALRRDPRLEPTVRAYLALVEAESTGADTGHVETLARRYGDTPLGREVRRYLERVPDPFETRPRTARGWQLSLSAGSGWNSNVIGIGDGIALPPDISDEASAFGRFTAQGNLDVLRAERDVVRVGGAFQADLYESELDANLVDFFGFADYRHGFSDTFSAALRASDEYTFIGGSSFRNRWGVRPSAAWRACAWFAAEAAYAFADDNYMFSTAPAQDRDGHSNRGTVTAWISIPDTSWKGSFGVSFGAHEAEGADFDHDVFSLTVGVSRPLPLRIHGDLLYTHAWERYDNPNSLSATGSRRRDDIDFVTLQLTRPVWEKDGRRARVYLRVDFTNNDSNVAAYRYDQFVIGAGIIFDF